MRLVAVLIKWYDIVAMTLQIPIPEDLDEPLVRQLDRDAREAIAVRLYQEGKLSHGKFAVYLGIGRGEVDGVLGRHGVVDEFTEQEIVEQAGALEAFRKTRSATNQ